MREASSWCAGDDELAEHITRACLYAMGEDVEIDDIYGFAKGFHALPVSARRDLLGQSKAHEDKELLDFLRARHPDWLRADLDPRRFVVEYSREGAEEWSRLPETYKTGYDYALATHDRLLRDQQDYFLTRIGPYANEIAFQGIDLTPFVYRVREATDDDPESVPPTYTPLPDDVLLPMVGREIVERWMQSNGLWPYADKKGKSFAE
jgi:hypothetical protein